MLIATDALSLVFIACFLFGLLFLVATSLLGNLGHGHVGSHAPSHHIGIHTHAGSATHIAGHAGGHAVPGTHGTSQSPAKIGHAQNATSQNTGGSGPAWLTFINPTSIVLFLLGFGFFGYIFHATTHLALPLALVLAVVGGLVIAAMLLLALSRVFRDSEANTEQDVSDRVGLLGKVSITIQANGLGEVIYVSPGGMRKSIPAKSTDGRRLERGQEVVVINYERGVAEVDTWEHFTGEDDLSSMATSTSASTSASDDAALARLRALLEESQPADTELVIRKDSQKE
jgi:membrane protein implicated in regulation of membrane protease activity